MEAKPQFHGSDTAAVAAFYHVPVDEIVCFGANVNPLGLSKNLKKDLAAHLDLLSSYPDRNYTTLKKVIADYCQILPEHVIVGNGSTELISLLIQTRKPQKTLVLGPTYSEYGRELDLVGSSIHTYLLKESDQFHLDIHAFCEEIRKGYDLVILCNPNNPTSTAITCSQMRRILDACLQYGIFVMVDETYVEFAPEEKEVTSIPLTNYYTNLIILRGTSKFFAAPGLRLGYAVTGNQDLIKAINTRKNPWTINSLAEIAGRLMFPDEEYIQHTRELISGERDRLFHELSTWDSVTVYEASANFILMKIRKPGVTSQDLFDHCIRKGLMIRDCSTFPFLDDHFVRFCVMLPEQNERLLEAFREVLL